MATERPRKISKAQDAEQIGEIKATLDYLKDDFGLMREEMKVMNQTLAVNTASLETHIEGVKLAREQNELLKKDVDQRLEPIQKHVIQVNFLGKLVIAFVAVPTTIYYIAQLIRMLMGKI